MTLLKSTFVSLLLLALTQGCAHPQAPPSTLPPVNAAYAASATAGGGITYFISGATVASASTPCPATTGTAYAPINQGSPVSGLSMSLTSEPQGVYRCYCVQATQNGLTGACSPPSDAGVPYLTPSLPLAPNAGPTITENTGAGTAKAANKRVTVAANGPAPPRFLRVGGVRL